MALRCSTVCMVNGSDEMTYFKRFVSGLRYMEAARVKVLEDAIRETQEKGHPVSLKHLKECIGLIQKADLAIKAKRQELAATALNEWQVNKTVARLKQEFKE